jgi:hypothetical protein
MPDFDRIDLMNYAMYGNDFDPQWDEIRSYLKSSASAQKEFEEIKRTIPHPSQGKKRRDLQLTGESGERLDPGSLGETSEGRTASGNSQKSWWQKILGE